nr:unnamed protein product [Callosobruchus analis]
MGKECYCDDLYAAYQNMKLTDLTLNCEPADEGTCLIEVHRVVMGCASEEIFEKISAKDYNPILHLPYTVSTMKIIVELAYGQQVTIHPDIIPTLQEAIVALKMSERVRHYVEQCARNLANSPKLLEDNDGFQDDSYSRTLTDGDVTPELFFTPADPADAPEERMMASSQVQEIEGPRGVGSQTQPSETQDSVHLVQERISVVFVGSSSDDELIEPMRKLRNSNKTIRQRRHKKIPIKREKSTERDDIQTTENLSSDSSHEFTSKSPKLLKTEEQISIERENSTKPDDIQTTENLSSDSSDEFTSRSPGFLKTKMRISPSTISRTQEEVDAQQISSNRKEENNSDKQRNSSIVASTRCEVEEISNTDQRAVRSGGPWCTRAVCDVPYSHGDAALEQTLLNRLFEDEDEPPSMNRLKHMARTIEVVELQRLENLCTACLQFQDDINAHVESCRKEPKEQKRNNYLSCKDCGTSFFHASVLRFHACQNESSGEENDG